MEPLESFRAGGASGTTTRGKFCRSPKNFKRLGLFSGKQDGDTEEGKGTALLWF